MPSASTITVNTTTSTNIPVTTPAISGVTSFLLLEGSVVPSPAGGWPSVPNVWVGSAFFSSIVTRLGLVGSVDGLGLLRSVVVGWLRIAELVGLVRSVAGLVVWVMVGLEVKEFVVVPAGHGCVATGVIFKGGHRESSPTPPPPPSPGQVL